MYRKDLAIHDEPCREAIEFSDCASLIGVSNKVLAYLISKGFYDEADCFFLDSGKVGFRNDCSGFGEGQYPNDDDVHSDDVLRKIRRLLKEAGKNPWFTNKFYDLVADNKFVEPRGAYFNGYQDFKVKLWFNRDEFDDFFSDKEKLSEFLSSF